MYTAKRGYQPGDEPVGGYRLTKFLGKGQFGQVWQAKAPGGIMDVALKIIDVSEREGLKEFEALLRIKDVRHANLVEFVGCWVKTEDGNVLDDPVSALTPQDASIDIGGTILLSDAPASPMRPAELIVAMSLGTKTLFRRLQEVNPGKPPQNWTGIPIDELLDYMEQAARGIDYLNQRNYIHGDIKPQNLLIVGDSVKVCDFGLARAVDSLRKTQSGMGTVAYAAPELFEGKPHVQSDQYCLAISYIELRTGSLPFEEPNPYKVIELHRSGRLNLNKMPGPERSVIKHATQIKPEKRWSSCSEMVRHLRESCLHERAPKGRGWFGLWPGKSPADESLASGETSLVEEPGAEPAPGGDLPKAGSSKRGSGRRESPAIARATQTQSRDRDNTDAIAETLAGQDLEQLPPPLPRGVARRRTRLALGALVLGALAVGAYLLVWSGIGGGLRDAVGRIWREKPLREAFADWASQGEFDEAVGIMAKSKQRLVTVEYEQLCLAIRSDWGQPTTNAVVRRLVAPKSPDEAIEPEEACRLLESAEANEAFKKIVEGVPEALWQSIRERWRRTLDEALYAGDFDRAVEFWRTAPASLLAKGERERLRAEIVKQWSERQFEPHLAKDDFVGAAVELETNVARSILVPAEDAADRARVASAWKRWFHRPPPPADADAVAKAILELKEAKGLVIPDEEYLRELKLLREAWNKSFGDLLKDNQWAKAKGLHGAAPEELLPAEDRAQRLKDIQTAFDSSFVAGVAGDADKAEQLLASVQPIGLFSQPEIDRKRTAIRERRREQWLAAAKEATAKPDWEHLGKMVVAATSPPGLFTPAEIDAKLPEYLKHRQAQWGKDFEALLAKADWTGAMKQLGEVPAGLFPSDQIEKKRRQIRTSWDSAFQTLLTKNDWLAAKMLLDGVPEELVPNRDNEIGVIRKAFEGRLANTFAPPFDERRWNEAKRMLDDAAPINLFPEPEFRKMAKEVRQKHGSQWDRDYSALFDGKNGKKHDWAAAAKTLASVPSGLFADDEIKSKRDRIRDSWDEAFEPLAKDNPAEAQKMVATVDPTKLFTEPEIAARRAKIGITEAEWRKAFEAAFPLLLKGSKFVEAKRKLVEPLARKWLKADEVRAKDEQLRGEWFQWICDNWDKGDKAEGFQTQVREFLNASPDPAQVNAARLLLARALMRLGRKDDAEAELQSLADLTADQAYLREVLLAIAANRSPKLPAPKTPAAPWGLDSWERDKLPSMPPPPPPPIDKIAKAKSELAGGKYEEAAGLLRTLDPNQDQVKYLAALVALHAPQAKADASRQLLDALVKLYPAASAQDWGVRGPDLRLVTQEVPLGLGKLAEVKSPYAGQTKDLEAAGAWLQAARTKYGSEYPEIATAYHAILERRIALRVGDPQKPTEADWRQIGQWQELHKDSSGGEPSAGDELRAKAWRVECMLALAKDAASARDELVLIRDKLVQEEPAYAGYLRCRVLAAAAQPVWEEIVRELTALTPVLTKGDPILKAQDRARILAKLMIEAAGRKRRKSPGFWSRIDQIPFNPFGTQAEAEQYAKLLKAAGESADAGKDPEWKRSFVLAAYHQPKPETERVWSLARDLLAAPEAESQPDLLPVLFAGVSSFWQQPSLVKLPLDDPQMSDAVRATTRLLQLLGKIEGGTAGKAHAQRLYQSILQPAVEGAEFQAKLAALRPTGSALISGLSAAVAEFLGSQRDAEWPLPKNISTVNHLIENQATLAIELAPKDKPSPDKLADCYATRAIARSFKSDLNTAEVLKDAQAAMDLKSGQPDALGARAYALLMRARTQTERGQILKDLSESVEAGEEAVKNCPPTARSYATHLLNLGNTHLILGNYETEAEKKKRHFAAARDAAEKAAKLKYDDTARLTLGNIYEDLASQVDGDLAQRQQNYLEARRQFSEVADKLFVSPRLRAQSLCSRGRCNFKAVIVSGLDPQTIGLGDPQSALSACKDDFQKAIQAAPQDSDRIESKWWLGQISQVEALRASADAAKGLWDEADKNLREAKSLAQETRSPSQAVYAYQWSVLPLHRAEQLAKSRSAGDPEVRALLDDAEKRGDEIRKTPAGAFIDPAKKGAWIVAQARQRKRDVSGAKKAYEEALPQDLSRAQPSDVPLVMGLADCNVQLAVAKNNDRTLAEAAVRDAERAMVLASALSQAEQADIHYLLAQAHYLLIDPQVPPEDQHRDKFLASMGKAVEGTQPAKAVLYLCAGANRIKAIGDLVKSRSEAEAATLYQQAAGWYRQALELATDTEQKKVIEGWLKAVER